MEAAMIYSLEQVPAFEVPASFAARVARLAVAQSRPVRSSWTGFGVRAASISAVVLIGVLFAFAPHTTPNLFDVRFDVDMLLLAEVGGAAYIALRFGLND